MERGIRVCNEPGKFEGELLVAKLFYSMANDGGCDDEFGDVSGYGAWYGLLKGPFKGFQEIDDETPLTQEEKEFLEDLAGVIIRERQSGFVDLFTYTRKADLMRAWNSLMRKYEREFLDIF